MSGFADYFSKQAGEYARYRPQYPSELFAHLASVAPQHRLAWDCGTGSGQAALGLARHFDWVVATDASSDQLKHAAPHERIDYRVARAEDIRLDPGSVDLVTVATAVHWFDLKAFYQAVRRVAAPEGVLAVWTYHMAAIDPAIDRLLEHLYHEILGDYWPGSFRYVIDQYRTLPFPFEELPAPTFEIQTLWRLEQLAGFLGSWSATGRYRNEHGQDPVSLIWPELAEAWGEPDRERLVRWPLYLRVGRIRRATAW